MSLVHLLSLPTECVRLGIRIGFPCRRRGHERRDIEREWQGDGDDDLPTLRPRIYLPPVELRSSDDESRGPAKPVKQPGPPAFAAHGTLGFEGWSRWRQLPRSTAFAVILSPKGELMRWVHIQLIRKREGRAWGGEMCWGGWPSVSQVIGLFSFWLVRLAR